MAATVPHHVDFDVVVVGAGPAGMGAARAALLTVTGAEAPDRESRGADVSGSAMTRRRICLVDAGPNIEGREASGEVDGSVCGSGGASLCNDGKWSFGTAGSALRQLRRRDDAVADVLALLGLDEEPVLGDDVAAATATVPTAAAVTGATTTSARVSAAGATSSNGPAATVHCSGWDGRGDATPVGPTDGFVLKRYPSIKTDTTTRLALVRRLEAFLAEHGVDTRWLTRVLGVAPREDDPYTYNVTLQDADGTVTTVTSRAVILATGRMGPLALHLPRSLTAFRRVSVGVRLSFTGPSDNARRGLLNPTWIWNTHVRGVDVQFRSFCWCEGADARIVETALDPIGLAVKPLSGTTDPPPTSTDGGDAGGSVPSSSSAAASPATGPGSGAALVVSDNVGLMVRLTAEPSDALRADFLRWLGMARFECAPSDIATTCGGARGSGSAPGGDDDGNVGDTATMLGELLQVGVDQFTREHSDTGFVRAVGPCIEGVGNYPDTDASTQRIMHPDAGPALFAVGDGAGHLRGLVPSFVSGWCAGAGLSRYLAVADAMRAVASRRPAGTEAGKVPTYDAARVLKEAAALPFEPPEGQLLMYEVHTFLAPLNPADDVRALYYGAVEAFNEHVAHTYPGVWKPMKAPFLGLKFRDAYVHVMQSARYAPTNDYEAVVRSGYEEDAAVMAAAGFEVLRVKIELSMHGTDVVPAPGAAGVGAGVSADAGAAAGGGDESDSDESEEGPERDDSDTFGDGDAVPGTHVYSEHHIRVLYADADQSAKPSAHELAQLEGIAAQLQAAMHVPVALSFNMKKHESVDTTPGRKRFLNTRFRNTGKHAALQHVSDVRKYAEENGPAWTIGIPIDEWVVHDTMTDMDRGWIDPSVNVVLVVHGERGSPRGALTAALQECARVGGVDLRIVSAADMVVDAARAAAKQTAGTIPAGGGAASVRDGDGSSTGSSDVDVSASEAEVATFVRDKLVGKVDALVDLGVDTLRASLAQPSHVGVVLVPDVALQCQLSAIRAAAADLKVVTVHLQSDAGPAGPGGGKESDVEASGVESLLEESSDIVEGASGGGAANAWDRVWPRRDAADKGDGKELAVFARELLSFAMAH